MLHPTTIKLFVGISGPYNLELLESHLHARGLDSSIIRWVCNGNKKKYSPTLRLLELINKCNNEIDAEAEDGAPTAERTDKDTTAGPFTFPYTNDNNHSHHNISQQGQDQPNMQSDVPHLSGSEFSWSVSGDVSIIDDVLNTYVTYVPVEQQSFDPKGFDCIDGSTDGSTVGSVTKALSDIDNRSEDLTPNLPPPISPASVSTTCSSTSSSPQALEIACPENGNKIDDTSIPKDIIPCYGTWLRPSQRSKLLGKTQQVTPNSIECFISLVF